MYYLLAAALSLSALLLIRGAGSLVAILLWVTQRGRAQQWPVSRRARFLFALSILPTLCAPCCIFIFLVPAYLKYEPRNDAEALSPLLLVISGISLIVILAGLYWLLAAVLVTRKVVREWLQGAKELANPGRSISAYCVENTYPFMAVTGVFRPKIFVANRLLEELSSEELEAALAHEMAHVEARDNLKKLLFRACSLPGLLSPMGLSFEQQWEQYAEQTADERAAPSPKIAVELAGALVKIARVTPVHKFNAPLGAFFAGENSGIPARVMRLTRISHVRDSRILEENRKHLFGKTFLFWTLCLMATYMVTYGPMLKLVHMATEIFVAIAK